MSKVFKLIIDDGNEPIILEEEEVLEDIPENSVKRFYISKDRDPYMQMFLRDYCLRPSCYECVAKKEKMSDLTVADFWGIKEVAPEMNDNKGVSLVIIRSQRGQSLFDTIQEKLCYKKVDYNAAIKYNPSEITSAPRPKERNKFFTDLEKKEFIKMEKKYKGLIFILLTYGIVFSLCVAYRNSVLKKDIFQIGNWIKNIFIRVIRLIKKAYNIVGFEINCNIGNKNMADGVKILAYVGITIMLLLIVMLIIVLVIKTY